MVEDWDINMSGKVEVDGSDVQVTLVGEIDAATGAALQRRMDKVIESTTGAVLLDMSGISFIDSTGITVLVSIHRRLSAQRRSLTLRNVSASVQRVFDLTGVGEALGISGTT